jgi:amylovoran biosynthesis glycosyltransferase AmsE
MYRPDFSVLMSLYHAENPNYLDDCFNTLYSQTCQAKQVVLVIDGPVSNDLWRVVNKWEDSFSDLCILKLEHNVGLGEALNLGLNECKYNLVARVDTDDLNLADRFEQQLKIFEQNPLISICGSQIDEMECETKAYISTRKVAELNADIIKSGIEKCPFNHMTVMFKKDAVLSVGGYQHMQSMEDWYLWLRLLSNNYIGYNIQSSLVQARTGIQMMSRRSGYVYVKCEANIAMAKAMLFPQYKLRSYLFFFVRAIPRLLPKRLLNFLYLKSRGKS